MAQVDLIIKTDEEVKKEFNSICEKSGMDMSVVINLFMKAIIREQRIPFDLALNPNKETIEAIEDVKKGKNLSKTFNNFEEMMEDLDV